MSIIVSLAVGVVIGFIVGILVGRKNSKTVNAVVAETKTVATNVSNIAK